MVDAFKVAWLNTKSDEVRNSIEIGWALLLNFQVGVGDVPVTPEMPEGEPLEQTIARLDKYALWGKLVVAEGAVMQRERDEFKRANSGNA
jgi:hypothetical protein